jgi:hypothetical protein
MPPKPVTGDKTYDEVTVLGLLLVIKQLGGTYSKTLADMAALDGKRTTSSFEHSLRAANKLAGELLEKTKTGAKLSPADIGRSVDGSPAGTAPNTPKKRKAADGDEDRGSAAKKKRTPAKKGSKPVDSGADGERSPLSSRRSTRSQLTNFSHRRRRGSRRGSFQDRGLSLRYDLRNR